VSSLAWEGLDTDVWATKIVNDMIADLDPLPVLVPSTGLCEKAITWVTWRLPNDTAIRGDLLCTLGAGHNDECAPMDSERNDVRARS